MPFPCINSNYFKFSELKVGQQETLTVKITEELIQEFANFSGDKNPIHLSEKEASKSIFKKRVAHGFLVSSFLSSIYANLLPGKGSILIEQDLKYLNPVFIDDEVIYKVTILKIDNKSKIIDLNTSCMTTHEVIEGRAKVLLLNL